MNLDDDKWYVVERPVRTYDPYGRGATTAAAFKTKVSWVAVRGENIENESESLRQPDIVLDGPFEDWKSANEVCKGLVEVLRVFQE